MRRILLFALLLLPLGVCAQPIEMLGDEAFWSYKGRADYLLFDGGYVSYTKTGTGIHVTAVNSFFSGSLTGNVYKNISGYKHGEIKENPLIKRFLPARF